MSSTEDSLQQRYGARSPLQRVLVAALAVLVILPAGGWLVWATLFHANPEVASKEIGHEVVDDHTATVTVQIEYGDEPVPATCIARAIAHDKTMVGEISVHPDPAGGPRHTFTIATDRRATTVDWLGCTAAGQPRPR